MSHTGIFNPINSAIKADKSRNISSLDPKLSRTNYYDGRLLKASDLIRDQLYLDERLREVGRVLGHGIEHGLEVQLNSNGVLSISSGLAVAYSGRVLELENTSLNINLFDGALISSLNNGFHRLARGLYAITLQYAEMGEGSAEIYPKDLSSERGFHFNAYAEGVEVSLVPLRTQLPSTSKSTSTTFGRFQNSVHSRSALVQEFISQKDPLAELPEDSIALGLLCIEHGRPSWLDLGLLRRPLRRTNAENQLQQDLHNHYEELLQEVLELREQSMREQQFAAAHYFSVLPPFGSIPKDSIDPITAKQNFFPKGFDVSIVPIRKDDLAAIIEQSKALEIIDLKDDKDVDIMILVPMSDHQFAYRARQLEHHFNDTQQHNKLAHFDSLALRLYAQPSVHTGESDAIIWNTIWAEASNILFVRRPTRVAETQVSAVVLASGYKAPDPIAAIPVDFEILEAERDRLEGEISDLNQVIDQLKQELAEDKGSLLLEAEARVIQLEESIRLSKQQAIKLNTLMDELRTGNNRLTSELQRAHEIIRNLQDGSTNDDSLKETIITLKQSLEEANAEIKTLKNQNVENSNVLSISDLIKLRGVSSNSVLESVQQLDKIIKSDNTRLALVNKALIVIEQQYDTLLWPSLLEIAQGKRLALFVDMITEEAKDEDQAKFIAKNGPQLGLSQALINEWASINEKNNTDSPTTPKNNTELLKKIIKTGDFSSVTRKSIERLVKERGGNQTATIIKVSKALNDQPKALTTINEILALLPTSFDTAFWSIALKLTKMEKTIEFRDLLLKTLQKNQDIAKAITSSSDNFKLTDSQIKTWLTAAKK